MYFACERKANADGLQLVMVLLTTFQLYNGAKVISIQQKPHFKFRILTFSWAGGMWYDTLL